LAAALVASCSDDEPGAFNVFLELDRDLGHAPYEVELFVDFSLDENDLSDFEVRWDFGDGATLRGPQRTRHTYRDAGEYVIGVEVRHPDGMLGTARSTVTVLESVNLRVSNVETRPRQAFAGDELSVALSLRNDADSRVQLGFELWLFLTDNPKVDVSDLDELLVLRRELVQDMPARGEQGSVVDLSFELRIPETLASGDYYVGAVVDASGAIGESDEQDNLALDASPLLLRNATTDGPDLLVEGLVAQPRRSRVLTNLSLQFALLNQGLSPALELSYAVFLSEDERFDPELDSRLLDASVGPLSTGQRLQFGPVYAPIQPAISTPGRYWVMVLVDPDDELVERNENNNLAVSGPIEVSDEPILDADITVSDFVIAPSQTYLGGTVSAQLELQNQGSQGTGSFICSIYLSEDELFEPERDLPLASLNVFELAGEQTLRLESLVSIPKTIFAESYWPFVICDASGVVVEYDEENNVQRAQEVLKVFVAAELDLFPRSISLLPSKNLSDGEAAQAVVEVCHSGSTGSGPSELRLFLSQDAVLDEEDLLLAEGLLAPLSAMACDSVRFDILAECIPWIDEYVLIAQLDPQRLLAETNEDNNALALSGVMIEGERCRCLPDAFEPNDFSAAPQLLDVGSFEATLCEGDSDWYGFELDERASLRVSMSYPSADAVLELLLFGPQLEALDASSVGSGDERVAAFVVAESGRYLLQVRSPSAALSAYALHVERFAAVSDAVDLVAGKLIFPEYLERQAEFSVQAQLANLGERDASVFRAALLAIGEEPGAEPIVLAERTLQMPGYSSRMIDFSKLRLPSDAPERLRFRLSLDVLGELEESDETNNLSESQLVVLALGCFDPLEPNDSFEEAVALSPQSENPPTQPNYEGLLVCEGAPDFYRFSAPSNSQLSIIAEHDAALGDIDLYLYDDAGREIASSTDAQNQARIDVDLLLGEEDLVFELRMHESVFNAERNSYDLTLNVLPAPPELQCEDSFERNDDFADAVSLMSLANSTGSAICPFDDEDFYALFLSAGTRLELRFENSSRFLRASLYDPNQNFVQSLLDPLGSTLVYTAPYSGRYVLKVSAAAGSQREEPYRIRLEGVDGVDLSLGSLLAPSLLSADELLAAQVLLANHGAQDAPGFELRYYLSEDRLLDGQDALLGAALLPGLAGGESLSLTTKLPLPSTAAGSYWLLAWVDVANSVDELDEFNNDIATPISILAACTPDAFESPADNDHPSRATDLAANAPISASICPADEDWYFLDTTAASQLNLGLYFSAHEGDLDLFLYDEAGALLSSAISADDDEQLVLSAGLPDMVYIRVAGFGALVRNQYLLDYSLN
jgi:hypothetical protein